LGAEPTESRAELKRRYVQLARISHPDAVRNMNKNDTSNDDSSDMDIIRRSNNNMNHDFTEIAAAWRILSDAKQRKRYDRSLQAEEFAENVGIWANDLARQAAPVAQWAMPFLRRTTATTLAGVTAAAQTVAISTPYSPPSSSSSYSSSPTGFNVASIKTVNGNFSSTVNMNDTATTLLQTASSNKNSKLKRQRQPSTTTTVDVSRAFATAMDAARRAGRYVDGLEMIEKSEQLEKRAWAEQEQAQRLKQELQQIVDRRLTMALRTPGSGLTSAEATVILQDYNQTIVNHYHNNIAGPSSPTFSVDDAVIPSPKPTMGVWVSPFGRRKQEVHVSIQAEIERLEQIEQSFIETQVADTQAQSAYQESVQQQLLCIQQLRQAEVAELQARRAWELAQQAVNNATYALEETSRTLTQAKVESKKSDYEMERQSISLAQQSEKVRTALREKEKVVRETRRKAAETSKVNTSNHGGNAAISATAATLNGGPTETYLQSIARQQQQQQPGIRYQYNLQEEEFLAAIPEEESPERFQELSELRAEERLLAETSSSLEEMASKLVEQALQLRKRAEELESRS
jgi:curved DNA-binding protein CbpA